MSDILIPPYPEGQGMLVKFGKPFMNLQSKFAYCMAI